MSHDELVEAAREASELVIGDMSVSQAETADSLDDLAGHATGAADAIREDIKSGRKAED